jgi:hypothetical protein
MWLVILITVMATQFGINPDYALCVASAESQMNPAAIGDYNSVINEYDAEGLWQFHRQLWGEIDAELGWHYGPEYRTDPVVSTLFFMKAIQMGLHEKWTADRSCGCLREQGVPNAVEDLSN